MIRADDKGRRAALQVLGLAAIAGWGSTTIGCKGGSGGGKAGASANAKGGGKGGGKGGKGGGGGLKYAVEAYPVEKRKMQYSVVVPGTLEPFEHVQVTARVSGAVDRVAFSDGQKVKKGDVLVVIDSARYQSTVNSASASLQKAIATQKDADAQLARRRTATDKHPGLIPGEEIATYETKTLTARADTALAQEALNAASLNLRDSEVRAPMDGVVQTRTVETGQYVQAGYLMATLLQSKPMLLKFDVQPLDAPRLSVGMRTTFTMRETERVFNAHITLIAGAAEADTHMIPVTAEVEDSEHEFWLRPGAFCEVTLVFGGVRNAIVIPRDAVRATERGYVVYTVDQGVAHERVVTLGANSKDGWVEVREGLDEGDKLVIRGMEPLIEGTQVDQQEVPVPTSSAFLPKGGEPPAPPSTSAAPVSPPGGAASGAASGSAAPSTGAGGSGRKAP